MLQGVWACVVVRAVGVGGDVWLIKVIEVIKVIKEGVKINY